LLKRATPPAVDAGIYFIECYLKNLLAGVKGFEIPGNRYRDRYGDPLNLDFYFFRISKKNAKRLAAHLE
jgi:hypothetical protein